jgi:Beta-ketoacyl synthase, N-terminal domain
MKICLVVFMTDYITVLPAGMPIHKIAGSRTSVHVGCFNYDYKYIRSRDIETTTDYDSIGVNANMNADRLSWFFDFRGASMVVDTACSSSLVALDLACHGLRDGDADMVNQYVSPAFHFVVVLTSFIGNSCWNKSYTVTRIDDV